MVTLDVLRRRFSLFSFFAQFSQENSDARKNPWVLALFVMVGVFLLVNLVFIVMAVISNPGLVVDDYYERGRDYEKNVVSRHRAHDTLNWQTRLELPQHIESGAQNMFRFSAVDERGVFIMDADVRFVIYRPSDAAADFELPVNQVAPGLYQTPVHLPLPGVWDLTVKVRHNEDVYYQTRRLFVK